MSVLVVTAADERYASLVLDLIGSLRAIPSAKFDIGCVDLGLGDETRRLLVEDGVKIMKPEWPFRPHKLFDARPTYLSRVIRPFLRDYFPGHETYIWLDADCWVQDGNALDDLASMASVSGLACVPAVDRSYFHTARSRQWLFQRYRMAFGDEDAGRILPFNYVNSGVFALAARAPHWNAWKTRFQKALDRWDGDFLCDQSILNALVYLDGMPAAFMPSEYNWVCHLAVPMWAPRKRLFVSPNFPWQSIGIVHNTFDDKSLELAIRSRTGGTLRSKLTYSAYRALAEAEG
jgi:lipopolysaccharide biosynthesis glycosyltransferase